MSRFRAKSVLITGAASGIGRATALAFAAEGASVLVVDQNGSGAHDTRELIRAAGGTAESMRADVSDYGQCQAMVQCAVRAFGGLHIAFNNAGIPSSLAFRIHEIELSDWQQMLNVNLGGVFNSIKAEVPAMLASGGGAIINTASVAGLIAAKNMASYVAAKHGVVGLTKAAALDLIGLGIRVNAVCPAATRTAMLEGALAIPEIKASMESDHPIGRAADADEVAKVVLFLASEEASFVVGHAMAVDGGLTIK